MEGGPCTGKNRVGERKKGGFKSTRIKMSASVRKKVSRQIGEEGGKREGRYERMGGFYCGSL